jgi:serine/threonine protein kinase
VLVVGFSHVHYYGVEGDFNVMVIDMLGPNLEALFQFCDKKFSLKTVCMLGSQCVTRMEQFHAKGFMHRDIKPENFLMGIGKKSHICYSIDFGLAKRYIDPKTGKHIQFKDNRGVTGTARYASLSAQMGNEQSRRDDLEAVGYVLCYLIKGGKLPWIGLKAKKKEKLQLLIKLKKETTFE